MIRECVDCHRVEDIALTFRSLLVSGGASSLYPYPSRPDEPPYRCAACRAKYPPPAIYTVTCEECQGTGTVTVIQRCPDLGCEHCHTSTQDCDDCDGHGCYQTHDCNQSCDHSTLSSSLPLIAAQRGRIWFPGSGFHPDSFDRDDLDAQRYHS